MGAAGVSPHDAASNLAAWAHQLGFSHVPSFLLQPSADHWGLGIGAFLIISGITPFSWKWVTKHAESIPRSAVPKVDVLFEPRSPYETSEVSNGSIHSWVSIGLKNSGRSQLSEWQVFVDGIAPPPKPISRLPILVKGGERLRNDEPATTIPLVEYWSHLHKCRFCATDDGAGRYLSASQAAIMDAEPERVITVRVQSGQYRKRLTFKVWIDESEIMRLTPLGEAD